MTFKITFFTGLKFLRTSNHTEFGQHSREGSNSLNEVMKWAHDTLKRKLSHMQVVCA